MQQQQQQQEKRDGNNTIDSFSSDIIDAAEEASSLLGTGLSRRELEAVSALLESGLKPEVRSFVCEAGGEREREEEKRKRAIEGCLRRRRSPFFSTSSSYLHNPLCFSSQAVAAAVLALRRESEALVSVESKENQKQLKARASNSSSSNNNSGALSLPPLVSLPALSALSAPLSHPAQ